MFDWISHNKEVFLQSHTEIGRSYQHAVELQTQHNHFAMNSMVANVIGTIILLLHHCTSLCMTAETGRGHQHEHTAVH